jgi:hypothetical protein
VVVVVLVGAVVTTLGGRAEAATGPTFVGGQQVAPYDGNFQPSLSYNGTKTLVVWSKVVGSQLDVWGRIMAPDSTTIGDPFPIATGVGKEGSPDVAWNGSSWLVVWFIAGSQGLGPVKGRRVSPAGALLGSEIAIAAGGVGQARPAVAAGANSQFFVAWTDRRVVQQPTPHESQDIYGRRISASGGVLDGSGVRLSHDSASQPTGDDESDVAWNGSTYLVVWHGSGVMSSRIDSTQRRADGSTLHSGFLTSSFAAEPSVASDGHDFLVVFSIDDGANPADIGGVRVRSDDFTKSSFTISNAANGQGSPAVAFNGVYLVAWVDRRNGDLDIWGARVNSDNTVVDPNGFLITEYYPQNDSPAITQGGTKASTFGFGWSPTPDGLASGVVAYGIQFAPK